MKARHSLRRRLYGAALIVILIVMVAGWLGLTSLFARHVERRVGQELDTHLRQLAGAVELAAGNAISLVREPADPRFSRIGGGLYWEIRVSGAAPGDDAGFLRSRSLWDAGLPEAAGPPAAGQLRVRTAPAGDGASLWIHERALLLPAAGVDRMVTIGVAIDRAEIEELRSGFGRDLAPALLLLGLVLFAGFAFQVEAGLAPLKPLRHSLARIRAGLARRMEADVPMEIGPLADEINSLLDEREAEMTRARDRAADLAHGLRTPLTAMAADIEALRREGREDIASDLEALAESMRRHVERELVRARTRHSRGVSAAARPVVEAIARTLARTPQGADRVFDIEIDEGLTLPLDADDLAEILGNLMDNAVRHARHLIRIEARDDLDVATLEVEDDGPGMTPDQTRRAIQRGVRLDLRSDGSGLGLSIVEDIMTASGGRLQFGGGRLGGLRVTLSWPRRGEIAD